jgi:hypothetical protein
MVEIGNLVIGRDHARSGVTHGRETVVLQDGAALGAEAFAHAGRHGRRIQRIAGRRRELQLQGLCGAQRGPLAGGHDGGTAGKPDSLEHARHG